MANRNDSTDGGANLAVETKMPRRKEKSHVERLREKGLSAPERRDEITDLLIDQCESLRQAADALQELLVGTLEGNHLGIDREIVIDPHEISPAEVTLTDAVEAFDDARREAVGFLFNEGGFTPQDISSVGAAD